MDPVVSTLARPGGGTPAAVLELLKPIFDTAILE